MKYQLFLATLLVLSLSSFATPRKDADGHYMVKSITRIYNGKESGKYDFSYNVLGKIVKVDFRYLFDKTRRVLSWYGNKITYKQYNWEGKQDPLIKYEYVLDDEGQIIFVSFNDLHGGSQLMMENDYYYEDGRLVHGEFHEYRADNLTDEPKWFPDTYHFIAYDYPDGDIVAMLGENSNISGQWKIDPKQYPLKPDIEYWLIENNTNLELSALYFTYSPYPIDGANLAFLAGWMKMRGMRLVSKYGDEYTRTRIDYTFDEYNRPIYAKCVPDTEYARFADRCTAYRIEYVDE